MILSGGLPDKGNRTADDPEINRLVQASRDAEEAFIRRRNTRRGRASSWLGLCLAAFLPLLPLAAVPDKIAAAVPAAVPLYEWLGQDINFHGVDVRDVQVRHFRAGEERVIAVSGELINISGSTRAAPRLRLALADRNGFEVSHWEHDPQPPVLLPGQAQGFVTRIISPPETASSIEIRFAPKPEIGSNANP